MPQKPESIWLHDGTMQQPARTITTSTGSTISNSSFDIRETEDNLIIIYLISSLSDEVLAQALQCDDIMYCNLAGLGPEIDSLVSMITHCDNSLILEDIYSMLLTYEAHIKRNNQVFHLANGSANIVTRQPSFPGGRGGGPYSAPRGKGCHPFTVPTVVVVVAALYVANYVTSLVTQLPIAGNTLIPFICLLHLV
uniref:Uncharacterized protein n=1 Tax=Populus alba TaxID=43335 RepID=A0A4U5QNS2_POPAL|nr:hypothetical protein D5086_0000083050 [Populus alba]